MAPALAENALGTPIGCGVQDVRWPVGAGGLRAASSELPAHLQAQRPLDHPCPKIWGKEILWALGAERSQKYLPESPDAPGELRSTAGRARRHFNEAQVPKHLQKFPPFWPGPSPTHPTPGDAGEWVRLAGGKHTRRRSTRDPRPLALQEASHAAALCAGTEG